MVYKFNFLNSPGNLFLFFAFLVKWKILRFLRGKGRGFESRWVSTFLFLVFFSIPAIFGLSNTLIIKIIFFKLVDYYRLVDDHLGSGAYASVKTAINLASGEEYAVKVVNKHKHGHTRSRIMREVQIFKLCRNHPNIGIYFCLHLF